MKTGQYVVFGGIPCVVVYTTSSTVYLSAMGVPFTHSFSREFVEGYGYERYRMPGITVAPRPAVAF